MIKQYNDQQALYDIGKNYYNDTNNCSVVAVAISTGVAYGAAFKALEKRGRRRGQGVSNFNILKAIVDLGFMPDRVEGAFKTVRTITDRLPSEGKYIVLVSGHILAVRDGKVLDWTEGRRHRIEQVYKVTPREYKK